MFKQLTAPNVASGYFHFKLKLKRNWRLDNNVSWMNIPPKTGQAGSVVDYVIMTSEPWTSNLY